MFSVTGPVMRSPSAWRGEATNWIPNRPRSQPIVPRTLTSALQALQSPALTTRSFSERPNSRRSFRSSASASGSACPVRTRSSRRRTASRKSCVNAIAPSGQAVTHSVQNRHRPRSSASGPSPPIASVGQTSAHARHPSGHFAGSRMGAPRYRSGIGGGSPAGYAIVRCPWCARASSAFSMKSPSQVVAAIGEVEALVAQREIRDLAAPHREGDPQPVVEGRIGDLVAREAAGRVRDLAAPYGDSGLQILDLPGEEVESDAAGPDETAPESRPADLRRHVQEISALASAIRRGREIRDVARQGSEVADVVREPFELERDAANRVGARGDSVSYTHLTLPK